MPSTRRNRYPAPPRRVPNLPEDTDPIRDKDHLKLLSFRYLKPSDYDGHIGPRAPDFQHRMNLMQKELLLNYLPVMDADSKKRAMASLDKLTAEINLYENRI